MLTLPLCYSIFARDREIINQLLLEAKEVYTREDQNRVAIYTCDQCVSWHFTSWRASDLTHVLFYYQVQLLASVRVPFKAPNVIDCSGPDD